MVLAVPILPLIGIYRDQQVAVPFAVQIVDEVWEESLDARTEFEIEDPRVVPRRLSACSNGDPTASGERLVGLAVAVDVGDRVADLWLSGHVDGAQLAPVPTREELRPLEVAGDEVGEPVAIDVADDMQDRSVQERLPLQVDERLSAGLQHARRPLAKAVRLLLLRPRRRAGTAGRRNVPLQDP